MDEIFQRWVLHQDSLHQFRGSYDFMAAEGECFVHEILAKVSPAGKSGCCAQILKSFFCLLALEGPASAGLAGCLGFWIFFILLKILTSN